MSEYLYRYSDFKESHGCDEWENTLPGYTVKVSLLKFLITKKTRKGVWIEKWKFVLSSGKKRYAYPTTDEAMTSFIARKKRQIFLLKNQMADAERALTIAELKD